MKKIKLPLDRLDPLLDKVGNLTKIHRIVICAVTAVLIIGLVVWLSYYPKYDEISKLKQELAKLEEQLADAKLKAKSIDKYRKDMEAARAEFKRVARSLPARKEIPSLLTGVSRAGHDAGLEFLLFDRKDSAPKDFYAEIPIDIKVEGSYREVGAFFEKVSKLDRIVNIRNIKMRPKNQGSDLETACEAVTYMFIEKSENKDQTDAAKKGKKG